MPNPEKKKSQLSLKIYISKYFLDHAYEEVSYTKSFAPKIAYFEKGTLLGVSIYIYGRRGIVIENMDILV